MISIFMNSKILALLSYLGVILTIYYSLRTRHKKIKYIIMRKGKKYVVAYWNACSQTIFKEDIHHLYCSVNTECQIIDSFSTDLDVPFIYSLSEPKLDSYRGKNFNRVTCRMNLSVDFMNKKSGYIIELDNQQKENKLFANLLLFGRIRGEKMDSVHWSNPLEISIIKNPKELITSLISFFSASCSVIPLITIITGKPDLLIDNITEHSGLIILLFLAFSFFCALAFYNIYINSAPREIKKRIQDYKKNGYKEIEMYYY